MRIAVLCCTYLPEMSYQENVWPEQLQRQGHEVQLFYAAPETGEPDNDAGFPAQAIKTRMLPHSIPLTQGLAEPLKAFDPEVILLMGDKGWGDAVWKDPALRHVPVASFFSENTDMHAYRVRGAGVPMKDRAKTILYHVIRGPSIRECCRHSKLVIGATPQTSWILKQLFKPAEQSIVDDRYMELPLGFDPDCFGFDEEMRRATRARLGISDDEIVVLSSSRHASRKERTLRTIIAGTHAFLDTIEGDRVVVVGFGDSALSRTLEEDIRNGPGADRIVMHPFSDRAELNTLFNAADITVFGSASISCQEALGTGTYVCFADSGSLDHLIHDESQGLFYSRFDADDLAKTLSAAHARLAEHRDPAARLTHRRQLAEASAWLAYDKLIAKVLDDLIAGVS